MERLRAECRGKAIAWFLAAERLQELSSEMAKKAVAHSTLSKTPDRVAEVFHNAAAKMLASIAEEFEARGYREQPKH